MKRRTVLGINGLLLGWFFLDMTGLRVADRLIVSSAYRDDGIFFIVFLLVIALFVFREGLGRYVLSVWLFLWFSTQFASHWVFTLFGPAEQKNAYFSGTMKLIKSSDVYIPDLYHIVLHILIMASFVFVVCYRPSRASD